MISKVSSLMVAIIGGLALSAWPAWVGAQDFYKGKTIRIVVGFAPGGGFDTYSRLIARHMGKHLPGNPNFIVQNMTGAGSLIAANYVYRVAKPDGLTLGHFGGGLFMQQLLGGAGVEFDARQFGFIGVPVQDTRACALTKASGITSMDRWVASQDPVNIGATAPGDLVHDAPKILQAALGLPMRIVPGFSGTAPIRAAAERGELDGACWGWDSIRATWADALQSGDAVVVVQMVSKPHPQLPNVPLAIDYAKTEDARRLIETGVTIPAIANRPYVLPPGTPQDRLQMMRRAFEATMKDPAVMADVQKMRLDLNPLSGEETEKIIASMFDTPPAVIENLKKALK